jgi:DNA-binding winged helix-turn-helix (wHTH) protein
MPRTITQRYDAKKLMRREISPMSGHRPWPAANGEIVEFGRFRILLRRRLLLADGKPVELGTRAFDVLLVLLEADGLLVTKDELLRRVWPGIVVTEENLKVQISAVRKALGADRDFIRTEFGRGYRFTATFRSDAAPTAGRPATRHKLRSGLRQVSWNCRHSLRGWGIALETDPVV